MSDAARKRLWPPLLASLAASLAFGCELPPVVFVVDVLGDPPVDECRPGGCSLREAILEANAIDGPTEIHFDLPAPERIELLASLPPIGRGTHIDGTTQPSTLCPVPRVHLDGSGIADGSQAPGLELTGRHSRVRGLVISGFPSHGVVVRGYEQRVECLFVGTDPTGTVPLGNGGHGIAAVGGFRNAIGGPAPEQANLLAANAGQGLHTEDVLALDAQNNQIGLDALGRALPNERGEIADVDGPPPPPTGDPAVLAALRRSLESTVADVVGDYATALEDAGLLDEYADRLGLPAPPRDLVELARLVAQDRRLFEEFTADVSAVLVDARRSAASYLGVLGEIGRADLPDFLLDAAELPPDRRNVIAETLAGYDPLDYVVSSVPSAILALTSPPEPILNAIHWHSLKSYGPTLTTTSVADSGIDFRICQPGGGTCVWPVVHDLLPWSIELLWESPELTPSEMEDLVEEQDFFLELRLNGQLLTKGPWPGDPNIDPLLAQAQGYWAASVPGAPCPVGKTCVATNVLARKLLLGIPPPWTFELSVLELQALASPVPAGVDEHGNLLFYTHESKLIGLASQTVLPNGSNWSTWFQGQLIPTFRHPRCTDCHGFGNEAALAAHHVDFYPTTQSFVQETQLTVQPSLYVPGGQVMGCSINCHNNLDLVDPDGHPFHETEWRAPYQNLNVNWLQQTDAQICNRVLTNLPTQALRHQHFHGDSRLHWAITNAGVMSVSLSKAPPFSWDEFLRRVDLWNFYGTPCP